MHHRRNQRSTEAQAYRRWYKTARWRRLRQHQLATEPTCRMCRAIGRLTMAAIVDHVVPHKGSADLFWRGELQSLCRECHDRHKQAMERGSGMAGTAADGIPLDPSHPWNAGRGGSNP